VGAYRMLRFAIPFQARMLLLPEADAAARS
jgi:hypothetical protein